MRVLQVIDSLNTGGAERVFVNMVNMLADTSIDVEVLLFRNEGALIAGLDAGVKTNILGRTNKYSVQKLYQCHKVCNGFDIVHVHMRHCYTYVRLGQLLFAGKYKLILHDHYGDIEINREVPLKLSGFFKPVYYIGVSNKLTTWGSDNLKARNVYLLQNMVHPSAASFQPEVSAPRAIVIANFRRTKNIEFAAEVCWQLNIGLDIYGNRVDITYAKEIAALPGDIKIMEGISDFAGVYGRYSFALHTSISETGPLVLMEYLANGLPFVAYKTGDVADTIAAELPECFIDNFVTEEWVKKINTACLMGDELPHRMRTLFRKYYNAESYREKCLQIYSSVSCS